MGWHKFHARSSVTSHEQENNRSNYKTMQVDPV